MLTYMYIYVIAYGTDMQTIEKLRLFDAESPSRIRLNFRWARLNFTRVFVEPA